MKVVAQNDNNDISNLMIKINLNNSFHRPEDRPQLDVFDMVRRRLPVSVRRPSSRKLETRNLSRIHDSLQLQNSGNLLTSAFSEREDAQDPKLWLSV